MKIYVVHYTAGGYAREDSGYSKVVGAYEDAEVANRVRQAWGLNGTTVTEIELGAISAGIKQNMLELFRSR